VTAPHPDLAEALRDRYTLERELGRGGRAAPPELVLDGVAVGQSGLEGISNLSQAQSWQELPSHVSARPTAAP
jgi:hypothetical protein